MQTFVLVIATLIGQARGIPADENRGLTILDFKADWCSPCRAQRPRIDSLVKAGYPVKTVDIDADKKTASKYHVESVPTLIIVDHDGLQLSRRVGPYTAKEIAAWYKTEFAKLGPIAEPESDPQSPRPPPVVASSPWQTVCRVDVKVVTPSGNEAAGAIGYGSGTIVKSDGRETVILTCAHIFAMGNPQKLPADQFPSKIRVQVSDGKPAHKSKDDQPQSRFAKNYAGEPIDYDFVRDVGLVRISTSDVLPVSSVVPKGWAPSKGTQLKQYGCKGADYPTMFETTVLEARSGIREDDKWVGFTCERAPGEGRSGGGIFTADHLLCGVTDFRSLAGPAIGYYAHPESIHAILDKNNLAECYTRTISEPPARTPEATPREENLVEADPPTIEAPQRDESRLRKLIEETCGLFHRKQQPPKQGPQGIQGEQGPAGPAGPNGTAGKDGKNGRDGKDGVDGKDGKDATGGTPVDLSDILKRLAALEADNKALKEEAEKPITVKIKTPSGQTVSHDFKLRKNQDGQTGIGANFPSRMIGIDMSDFAVPSKAPSAK